MGGHEKWVAPLMGVCSGFSGGVSSFFGAPIALYLFLLESGAAGTRKRPAIAAENL
ncbi:MAG: hypothetical protein OEN55_13935 [Alphaproteobacteria bacterium]|nr:hypothetical protein [Alphaproteobacteria bacterium]